MKDVPVNLSDAEQRRRLIGVINAARGPHRVTLIKFRPRRSDRQNAFYWSCCIEPFARFLADQGEAVGPEDAHAILKYRFLRREIVCPETGEVLTLIGSTAKLNTTEFNEYLDRCAAWLSDMFDFVLPEPRDYHEPEPEQHHEHATQHCH